MPRLPTLSGARIVRNFERFGWQIARRRGGHIIMTKPGNMATLSVPNHATVARGTLRSLIRAAGLAVDEFSSTLEPVATMLSVKLLWS